MHSGPTRSSKLFFSLHLLHVATKEWMLYIKCNTSQVYLGTHNFIIERLLILESYHKEKMPDQKKKEEKKRYWEITIKKYLKQNYNQ